MKRWIAILIVALLASAACAPAAAGEAPPPQAASAPAASASQPTSAAAADPQAVKILREMEQAGNKVPSLRADIAYTVENPVLGTSEVRGGWVACQDQTAETPTKIRIHFDTVSQEGGERTREQVDYAFDGEWATVARQRTNLMQLYQLAAPGEKIRALKIGQGPLPPLPFWQKADDVVKYFLPTTRPLGPKEPAGTVYLKLTARPDSPKDLSFQWLEMWIDAKTLLPVRIVAKEPSKNLQTVELKNFKLNEKLKPDLFDMDRKGWKVEIQRYEK